MIKEQVSLYFQQGTSDKEYHTQLVKEKGTYSVTYQYGRRGSSLKSGVKIESVTLEEAAKVYHKLVKSKLAKGYSEGETGEVYSTPDLEDRKTNIYPQLLNEIRTKEELNALLEDDDFIAQEKFDGERRMVESKKEVIGINKKGLKVALPTCIEKDVQEECVIDSEIIGNKLYAFDIISYQGKSLKSKPYEERLDILQRLSLGTNVKIIKTAVGTRAKKAMLKRLLKNNAEGIVFKRKDHKYKAGRPARGGDVFKYKFYKTATCRVSNHTKGKRSIALEMLDKGIVPVGKVTIPANKEIPKVGSYVEVRYLYAYKGGSLYQPTYLGERFDQDDSDINVSQLIYKGSTCD